MATKEWSTSTFLSPPPVASTSTLPSESEDDPLKAPAGPQQPQNALVILNTPLVRLDLFAQIWDAASVRYCADGGANRLYDAFHKSRPPADSEPTSFLPDLIKGDLDSIKPHVREYFESKGVPVIHDPDQNSTDLGKCIAQLVGEETSGSMAEPHQLIIMGGLSGRLDQTAHTVHALMQLAEVRKWTWAIGADSIACVLGKGKHRLHIDKKHFGDTCAVLPFGQEARVSTKGQKWDLGPDSYAYPTSIAHCVSSSNHLEGEQVEIETDVPVVWTVEVRDAE